MHDSKVFSIPLFFSIVSMVTLDDAIHMIAIFIHLPYSPYSAPCLQITHCFHNSGGKQVTGDNELKNPVNHWLNELTTEGYDKGILKVVNPNDK